LLRGEEAMRTKTVALVLLSISAILFFVWWGLENNWILEKSKNKANARIESEVQLETAAFNLLYVVTSVELTYRTPVTKSSSVDVNVTIGQKQVIRDNPSYGHSDSLPAPKEVTSLEWPITITLKSAAFKFAKGEDEKKLASGSQLPINVLWSPIAASEGDARLILHFSNINGQNIDKHLRSGDQKLSLSINGKTQLFGLDDDIPLPITVKPPGGVPEWLWKYLAAAGAIITFLFGSEIITGWFAKLWSRITGTVLPGDYS
jgi:hypothetical protein